LQKYDDFTECILSIENTKTLLTFEKNKKMRLLAPYITLILFIFGCSSGSTEYTLNGTIDLEDGQSVLLLGVDDQSQLMPIDTVKVEAGTFSISGSAKYPEMHYLNFEGVRSLLPLVLEPGIITVQAIKDSIQNASVRGTKSNLDVSQFLEDISTINMALREISFELRNAMLRKDSLNISDLQDQYDNMVAKLKDFELSYITDNPDSYVSSLILEQQVTSGQIDSAEAQILFDQLDGYIKKTKSAQNIQKLLNPEEVQDNKEFPGVGEVAPDFQAPSPEGELVSLYDTKKKFTVIDFWASWCKPCRNQSPELVDLYNTYQSKGVTILSVSLDRNNDRWLQAIKDDHLNWTHVSNLKHWQDPIAAEYNVRSIPELFLIDDRGAVLARTHDLASIKSILRNATADL
jgi:peroxiredoxin